MFNIERALVFGYYLTDIKPQLCVQSHGQGKQKNLQVESQVVKFLESMYSIANIQQLLQLSRNYMT